MAVNELSRELSQARTLPRYILIVTVSLVIMACAGSLYAWSIFVEPLIAEYGLTVTHTQTIFGGIISCFGITMLFVNLVLSKHGPRVTAGIGAVLYISQGMRGVRR